MHAERARAAPLDIRIEDDTIVTESDCGSIACGVSVAVESDLTAESLLTVPQANRKRGDRDSSSVRTRHSTAAAGEGERRLWGRGSLAREQGRGQRHHY